MHPVFPPANPRHLCNARSVTVPTIWYTPQAGYVGDDSITVETITASGAGTTVTINIHVK